MPIQNVITHAPIAGAVTRSFRQVNVDADFAGAQATAQKMYESLPHVSNMGNETKVGTSNFQMDNKEVVSVSVEKMAEIMERDDEFVEVSNTGNETLFGPSGFQNMNDTSITAKQQVAAQAYTYFDT